MVEPVDHFTSGLNSMSASSIWPGPVETPPCFVVCPAASAVVETVTARVSVDPPKLDLSEQSKQIKLVPSKAAGWMLLSDPRAIASAVFGADAQVLKEASMIWMGSPPPLK